MANLVSWEPGIKQPRGDGLHKLALVWKGYTRKEINLKWLGDLWKYPEIPHDISLHTVKTEITIIWLAPSDYTLVVRSLLVMCFQYKYGEYREIWGVEFSALVFTEERTCSFTVK